jgi:hypothetical protein
METNSQITEKNNSFIINISEIDEDLESMNESEKVFKKMMNKKKNYSLKLVKAEFNYLAFRKEFNKERKFKKKIILFLKIK